MISKRFKVDESNKTVIAFIDEYTGIYNELTPYGKWLNTLPAACPSIHVCNCKSFKSVAHCDERDEWDVEKGKELAGVKADYKYHKSIMKDYRRLIDWLRYALKVCEELEQKHYRKCLAIERDIETYFN